MHRLHPGFTLGGRYELIDRVAAGGMGEVWSATDRTLSRIVAVKVMHPHTADDGIFARRFADEARNTAGLSHLNIATLFDFGDDDGLAYLVMELVVGHPLSVLLEENGAMPPTKVRSVIGQAALALSVAHEAGIVHRDVKPANILLKHDGTVKLTDFGISLATNAVGLTRTGEVLGTPYYISPEQAMGHLATPASDLYALGVVAHELLTGVRPFDKETPVATALAQVHDPPPPLPAGVPPDLAEVVLACLAKHPGDRPRDAREVAERLLGSRVSRRRTAMGAALGSPAGEDAAGPAQPVGLVPLVGVGVLNPGPPAAAASALVGASGLQAATLSAPAVIPHPAMAQPALTRRGRREADGTRRGAVRVHWAWVPIASVLSGVLAVLATTLLRG